MPVPEKVFFDSSKLKCYLECPRRFYWRYVRHLVPLHEQAALSFGAAIHDALFIWHQKNDLDAAIEAFHNSWDDLEGQTLRSHEKGEELLIRYARRYPPNREPFKFVGGLEVKVQIQINGITYGGRIDGIVEWGGMNLILDHKTATRMGPKYFNQFRPDLQMTGYAFMASQLMQKTMHGIVINVLYFTTKTYDFFREISSREPFEYQEFVQIVTSVANEILSLDWDERRSWRPNWTSCGDWGGCDYRELCLCEDPESLADTMYRYEVWHPFADNRDVIKL